MATSNLKVELHLSDEAKMRKPSILKTISFKTIKKYPGILSLAGGWPHPENFMIKSMSLGIADATTDVNRKLKEFSVPTPQQVAAEYGGNSPMVELEKSLQYSNAHGLSQYIDNCRQIIENYHAPPYDNWAVMATCGNISGFDCVFRTLCNRGDSLLIEEYAFPATITAATALGLNLIPVPLDDAGVQSDKLNEILEGWNSGEYRSLPKPKLIIIVPTGQNPTGVTMHIRRKREIYDICCRNDIIILEDDPYYFLQFSDSRAGDSKAATKSATVMESQHATGGATTADVAAAVREHRKYFVDSFLSIDCEGRVIRIDSFSKIAAPGLRVGFMTANDQFSEYFGRYFEHCDQNAAGPSQAIVSGAITSLGFAGFIAWLRHVAGEYQRRRDILIGCMESKLNRSICRWTKPSAGMFAWLTLDASKHPEWPKSSLEQLESKISERFMENGVACAFGSCFEAGKIKRSEPLLNYRLSFSILDDDLFSRAVDLVAKTINEEFLLNNTRSDQIGQD